LESVQDEWHAQETGGTESGAPGCVIRSSQKGSWCNPLLTFSTLQNSLDHLIRQEFSVGREKSENRPVYKQEEPVEKIEKQEMPQDTELIRKWISSSVPSTSGVDDEDEDELPAHDRLTWEAAIQHARPKILTTKLSIRIPFLKNELLPLIKREKSPSSSEISELLKVLFQTIPRYEDAESRKAVISVVVALIEENDGISSGQSPAGIRSSVIKWISQEASKSCGKSHGGSCSAASTRLALLVWTALLLENWFSSSSHDASITTLVNALGSLLDSMQDPLLNRPAFQKSANVIVRRAIRNVSFFSLIQPFKITSPSRLTLISSRFYLRIKQKFPSFSKS
jgi:hypothetical protein